MDETANQMSDVREELADVLRATLSTGYPYVGADAILARFDVVEKPVVMAEECPDCAWNRRYPHVASSFAWSFCMRCRNTGRIERALSAGDGTTEDDRNDG